MTTTVPTAASSDAALKAARELVSSGEGLTSAQVAAMGEAELKAWGEALGRLRREVNTMMARVAHGQAELSAPQDGAGGMARRNGEPTPHDLVARQTGESEREAKRLIEVGRTLADAEKEPPADSELSDASDPDSTPLRFPYLSEASDQALIGIEAATMIRRMLEKVHDVADPKAWQDAERTLVAKAKLLKLRALSKAVRRTEANLFRSGVEVREQELRDARYLHVFEDNTGMIVINGKLDPETAAPIKVALDGLVAQGLQARAANKSITTDERTPTQMRADALGLLASHSLKCDNEELGLASVTLVVRMGLDEVIAAAGAGDGARPTGDQQAGEGFAEIDGIAQPISAGAARRLAGEAGVVPIVTSGGSVGLDVGRNRYKFSRAQKLALIERDGGCAMCGAPPSWCEAHHIQEWWAQAGKTDVSNGVMLCRRCHQDLHGQGWTVQATLHETWFTPPSSIDPERRPRPGGRKLHGGEPLSDQDLERLENAAKSPAATTGAQFGVGSGAGVRSSAGVGSGAGVGSSARTGSRAQPSASPSRQDEPEPPPLTLCHRARSASATCSQPVDAHPNVHRVTRVMFRS